MREGFVLQDQHGDPTDIDTFRKLYGDEAGWQREYECQFTGELDALVKWNQLQAAGERGRALPFDLLRIEGDAAWSDNWLDGLDLGSERLEIGWDVARHGHLSAVSLLQPVPGSGGGAKHLRAMVLMHNTSFELQRRVVRAAMKRPRSVGCGDATGVGMDSNETLAAEFGSRWSGVTFTAKTKSELGSGLATAFGDAAVSIPPMDSEHKFIGVDVYGVQAEDTGGQDADKRLRLVETENALLPDSHCDIAYSLALALRAGATVSTEIGAVWL